MINVKTTPLKLWRYYVKYRFLRFFSSYLCTQNIIVMVDKRTLEFILTDQQEEILRKS